jgi:hypothetical protein
MENYREKTVRAEWTPERSERYSRLVIEKGASIKVPEGKFVTLTVDGVGTAPLPGEYVGDVRLTVCDEFIRTSLRFGEETVTSFRSGVCIDDGKRIGASSVSAIVRGGEVTDAKADGVSIESREWNFNGFYITGDAEYAIDGAEITLYGDGTDDFVGYGAGVAASGNAKVTVTNSRIHTEGIGRGTVFVGGHAEMTMSDCELSTVSYVPTPEQLEEGEKAGRMMEPPWPIGIRGNARALNIGQWGVLNLNRCRVTSNSWGVLSVDGATVNRMNVRDCLIELAGESGYGLFSICDDIMFDYKAFGDYGCIDVIDHSVVNVPDYGVIMSLGNSAAEIMSGSTINSRRFGVFIFRNSGGKLSVRDKSVLNTDEAAILVKGANTYIELDDAVVNAKNGRILQLMDNDDIGLMGGRQPFPVPVGETDVKDEGRDLTEAVADEDVFLTISNMEAAGDILNSTTNIKANCRVKPMPIPGADPDAPPPDFGALRGFVGDDLQGAKNLDVKLVNAKVRGVVSAAVTAYRQGLTEIGPDIREELGEVTQTPAPPVNNGVILSLDARSAWTVAGDSYLTKLVVEEGAMVTGADGGRPHMTVDGAETPLVPGVYTGVVWISPASAQTAAR